jgi:REP element-mobilizing transposase RayT
MANTYTQIYIHIVFAVKGRGNLIRREWKEELHEYITGIVRNEKQKLIAINSMPDHIHMLVGLKPDIALSNLVRDVKANSSRFVNEKAWVRGKFNWQEGFGAFSHSHSEIDRVVRYIQSQEQHHSKKSFTGEYMDMLKEFDVDFDGKYIFERVNGE